MVVQALLGMERPTMDQVPVLRKREAMNCVLCYLRSHTYDIPATYIFDGKSVCEYHMHTLTSTDERSNNRLEYGQRNYATPEQISP